PGARSATRPPRRERPAPLLPPVPPHDGYYAYLSALAREAPEVTMLRDAMITFRYQMRLLLREPVWIVIVMIQPLLYLALFGPLLEPIASTKGFPPGDAWQVFVPGMLIQLGIFGSMFVGFGIIAEIRYGTVERMRVTPASRLGLLLGRILRDTLVLLIQATLLTLIAVAFGLRVPASGALITVGIVGMLGIALSSLSYAAGLWLKSEDALAPLLNMVAVPILLLSGILLPMSLAPGWLRRLAAVNPFSHVVDGARAAFRGDLGDSSLAIGLVASALLAVLGLAVATRTFQRESA
ncbi:MAG TPA: ABC transporter permease, partial [Kofleriaceae bacterium]|nr:ABC transporter permease [Kofleriaceae bacterium]